MSANGGSWLSRSRFDLAGRVPSFRLPLPYVKTAASVVSCPALLTVFPEFLLLPVSQVGCHSNSYLVRHVLSARSL